MRFSVELSESPSIAGVDTLTPDFPAQPWQVSELLASLHQRIDAAYGPVRIEGEVGSLTQARSGHRYFSLKDTEGQIRCAWFRHAIRGVPISEGQKVIVHGRLAIYPQRGDLQLIVSTVEDVGEGALARAFHALKKRLEAEGLLAPERKPQLPDSIRHVTILCSPQAAALQDVLVTFRRRDPFLRLRLLPVPVQGAEAPAAIAKALSTIGTDTDVVLLTRGGGSLEDLQAFNEESVARAIAACPLPVVSAVGHETDFSISDFVASLRCPTPTAAAEMLSQNRVEQLLQARSLARRLGDKARGEHRRHRQSLVMLQARLLRQSPQRRLDLTAQRLDAAQLRLQRALRWQWQSRSAALSRGQARLHALAPQRRLQHAQEHCQRLRSALQRQLRESQHQRCQQLNHLRNRLLSLNPKQVMQRGYVLVHAPDGLWTRAADAQPQTTVHLEWFDGQRSAQMSAKADGT